MAETLKPASLFRQPAFALFWAARVCSAIGFQITAVVVGWQIYEVTGSTLALGLIGLAQYLPMLALTIPAGHLADSYNRRVVARLCQAAEGAAALVLGIGTILGTVDELTIFALAAAFGALRTIEAPSISALLPELVGEEQLPRALAAVSAAFQTATIIGPALGGLLYVLGAGIAYCAVALAFLGAVICLSCIQGHRPVVKREPVSLDSLLSGFGFVWRKKMLLGAISLDLFAVLLGGATALLPVYAADILFVGPVGLGVLRAAPAAGALLTSAWLSRWPIQGKAGPKMFVAVVIFGLATMIFGISQSFTLSFLALIVMGASDLVSVVVRVSLVQLGTPNDMRGRVASVNSMFIGTSNQLGEFESGITAAIFGTMPAVVLGGAGTVLVALLWMRFFPQLRDIDRLEAQK